MPRVLGLLALAALAARTSPAGAGVILYVSAAESARVQGYCIRGDGALSPAPVVDVPAGNRSPRRVVVANGADGFAKALYVAEADQVEVWKVGDSGGLSQQGLDGRLAIGAVATRDIALTPDASLLYVADNNPPRIIAVPLDADGGLGNGKTPTSCIQGQTNPYTRIILGKDKFYAAIDNGLFIRVQAFGLTDGSTGVAAGNLIGATTQTIGQSPALPAVRTDGCPGIDANSSLTRPLITALGTCSDGSACKLGDTGAKGQCASGSCTPPSFACGVDADGTIIAYAIGTQQCGVAPAGQPCCQPTEPVPCVQTATDAAGAPIDVKKFCFEEELQPTDSGANDLAYGVGADGTQVLYVSQGYVQLMSSHLLQPDGTFRTRIGNKGKVRPAKSTSTTNPSSGAFINILVNPPDWRSGPPVGVFATQFGRGRVISYRVVQEPSGKYSLPLRLKYDPIRFTPKDLSKSPTRMAIHNGVLYVPTGLQDRVLAYTLGKNGLLASTRPLSATDNLKDSFPNDVAVAVLRGGCE